MQVSAVWIKMDLQHRCLFHHYDTPLRNQDEKTNYLFTSDECKKHESDYGPQSEMCSIICTILYFITW